MRESIFPKSKIVKPSNYDPDDSAYYIPGKGVWAGRNESSGEEFMRELIFPKSKTLTPSNYDPDERKFEHALWALKQEHTKKAAIQGIRSLATKGNPRAQFVMCEVYAKGVGVTQSWTTAKKWCDRFVAQGYQDRDRLPEKVNAEVEKLKKAEIKRENLKIKNLAQKKEEERKDSKRRDEEKKALLRREKPENILESRYLQYITIKECHKLSGIYISSRKMKTAKSKIRGIQDYLKAKNKKMDTDAIWESASKKWDKEMGESFKIFSMLGQYSKDVNGICKLQFMGLSSVNIPGAKKKIRKKDF